MSSLPAEDGLRREEVLLDRDGEIGWVTLNRPDTINAINDAIREALPRALDEIERDPGIRVAVIRGAGPRGFCVGADIKEFKAVESPVAARQRYVRSSWIESIDRLSKPVIAAVHGYCFGGGMEIALACDIRIAAANALLSLPETGLGLIPGGGGTQRLPRLIGLGRALDLILTGDRIDASEAHRIGLVSHLVADSDALSEQARQLATRIAARPPIAIAFAKEAARAGIEMELQAGLKLEKDLFTLLLTTDDRLEAAAAFRDKRAPRFTGR